MKPILFILLLGLFPLSVTGEASLPPYSQQYDPSRDPFTDGRAALELANQTGRRVLIEVGGDWCSWCHILDRFLTEHQSVRQQLDRHFVVVKVNVSDENDNADFMAGLPKPIGYPHIYISDANGRILFSKDTAELLEGGHYSESRFLQFIDRWKAP